MGINIIIILNLGINLLTMFLFGYTFNNFKGIRDKSTYPFVLISYILGMALTSFSYNSLVFAYIIFALIFSVLIGIKNKYYNILNMLLMLNIILFTSSITAIPILFVGYNYLYILINIIIILSLIAILWYNDFSTNYYNVYSCWNRELGNKYKSVTVRNFTIISINFGFMLMNLFIVNYFMNIYTNF